LEAHTKLTKYVRGAESFQGS